MKKLLLLVLLSLLGLTNVYAATGPYAELNVGSAAMQTPGLNNDNGSLTRSDATHLGWNANVGMLFFGLGVEGGYSDFGTIKYSNANGDTTANVTSLHLALVNMTGIGPLFLLQKIGYGYLRQTAFDVQGVGLDSSKLSSLYWALGAGAYVLPMLRAQVEYQQIQGNSTIPTARLISVGIGYTFL